jgi:riboflavin-specific deaminase-like protein
MDDPLYAPLRADSIVLGRLAQSLDGRIATSSGQSRWISGPDDIRHTHCLRALCDAVLVGAGTVAADDPLLTTRLVAGPSPVRVILDPRRSLRPGHRVFCGGPATLLLCLPGTTGDGCGDAELLPLPAAPGTRCIDPATVVAALAARGLRRVLVEGGGITVSRFLAAGVLHRLHVTIAPLLLGSGIPAFTLPACAAPADGMRLDWTAHTLGRDLLFDIPLARRG